MAVVTSASAVLYVTGLSFYSDDWYYMAALHHAADGSFLDSVRSVHYTPSRPVHALYLADDRGR